MLQRKAMEEQAIVLDFLPHGHVFQATAGGRAVPIAQAIGKTHFVLLELVPKRGVELTQEQEVYIGDGKREEIHHIAGKITVDKLSVNARGEVERILRKLIRAEEPRFVEFFNKSQPLSTRMHQLELLPGVGKKHMWQIIEAREEKEFENLADIKERVKLMPDPEGVIMKRILAELTGNEKYRIFVVW